jgi:hypothetical protein
MSAFEPGEQASIASVTDRVRPVAIGAPVTAIYFLGDRAAFVGAEESVALVAGEGAISRVTVHGGGILCTASDGARIVMGGDDGKLVALDAKGDVALLATDPKRRWIDNVAVHPDGAVAWSARERTKHSTCPRPSAAWRSRQKACALRSPITTA